VGRRGPKPKPTKLRVLQGNAGKRALPKSEVQPRAADPLAAPTSLDALGLQKWRQLAPQLTELGLLTELDVDMLAMYCQTWSDWRSVRTAIAVTAGKDDGQALVIASGLAKREKELRTALRQLASEFGLSPASRSRVPAPPKGNDPKDPMDEFLRGGDAGA